MTPENSKGPGEDRTFANKHDADVIVSQSPPTANQGGEITITNWVPGAAWPVAGEFTLGLQAYGIEIHGLKVIVSGSNRYVKWPHRAALKAGKAIRRLSGGIVEAPIVAAVDAHAYRAFCALISRELRAQGCIQ